MLLLAALMLVGCDANNPGESTSAPVSLSGQTVRAKGIALAEQELTACNGVIHVVDMVLLHPAVERFVLVEEAGGDVENVEVRPEAEAAEQAQADKVTICHATHSETNPYNEITIARSGLNGHRNHEGDIIPAPEGGCGGEAPVSTQEVEATSEVTVTEEAEVVVGCEGGNTVAALLRADARFSTFVEMLEREGLIETLEEAGPYTVFAPTNAAFEALPPDVLATWQADDAQLTTVLLYHIVHGLFLNVDLEQINTISTLNAASIHVVMVDGTIYLERRQSLGGEGDQPEQDAGGGGKVTICHNTGSKKNPYNMITVDESALSAHEGHGDIIPAPAGGCPSE